MRQADTGNISTSVNWEVNMLKDLFEMQKVEIKERALLAEKQNSCEFTELKSLKADFDKKKAEYHNLAKDIAALEAQLAAFPGQMQDIESKITEQNHAIYDGSVSNVKELSAREAQVDTLRDRLAEIRSLQAIYQGEKEQKSAAAEQLKAEINEMFNRFNELKETFAAMQQDWQKRLEALAEERREMSKDIAAAELKWFESVKDKYDGTPVARLSHDQVCSGCHTIVPPITFKRTSQGQKTFCEKCGRTLFVED